MSFVYPGWYGKLPALGDFANRRLPAEFIDIWHDWLQQGLLASQIALRQNWRDRYLHAPIWRFVLMPDICGKQLWTGIMMPSVDRVGRYFPLICATALQKQSYCLTSKVDAWYQAQEELVLSMLDVNASIDYFEASLQNLPFPYQNAPNPDDTLTDMLSIIPQNKFLPGKSFWWINQHNEAYCFQGLPPATYFEMLLGRV